jgi:hypothetical protein
MCCISTEKTNKENINDMSPEEWLASETPTKAREQLANNQFPKACQKCELMELAGKPSMRQRPREYGPGISHLDIRFGNQCNLRCTMCYPGSSSSLYEEHNELKAKGQESPWGWFDYGLYNWYTDEQGRFNIGKEMVLDTQNQYQNHLTVGFEDPKELSYFMLACPHLKY